MTFSCCASSCPKHQISDDITDNEDVSSDPAYQRTVMNMEGVKLRNIQELNNETESRFAEETVYSSSISKTIAVIDGQRLKLAHTGRSFGQNRIQYKKESGLRFARLLTGESAFFGKMISVINTINRQHKLVIQSNLASTTVSVFTHNSTTKIPFSSMITQEAISTLSEITNEQMSTTNWITLSASIIDITTNSTTLFATGFTQITNLKNKHAPSLAKVAAVFKLLAQSGALLTPMTGLASIISHYYSATALATSMGFTAKAIGISARLANTTATALDIVASAKFISHFPSNLTKCLTKKASASQISECLNICRLLLRQGVNLGLLCLQLIEITDSNSKHSHKVAWAYLIFIVLNYIQFGLKKASLNDTVTKESPRKDLVEMTSTHDTLIERGVRIVIDQGFASQAPISVDM